jgi:3-oxoacyl-[acyl-carrier protein] reductase
MLLESKNAVVYGAGGAVGGAVARAFAREGAKVFLTGRRKAALEAVAEEIVGAGGQAEVAQVDALNRDEIAERRLISWHHHLTGSVRHRISPARA